MKKEHTVVIITTDKKTDLSYYQVYDRLMFKDNPSTVEELNTYYNLYILSDEEIKEGDWYYNGILKTINQCKNTNWAKYASPEAKQKIIATTDKSLIIEEKHVNDWHNPEAWENRDKLPNLPTQFIEQYITVYNIGKTIDKVMVEYELLCTNCGESNCDKLQCKGNKDVYYLLINPDNTINIKSIKESWSRKEVEQLIRHFDMTKGRDIPTRDFDNWIKNNL